MSDAPLKDLRVIHTADDGRTINLVYAIEPALGMITRVYAIDPETTLHVYVCVTEMLPLNEEELNKDPLNKEIIEVLTEVLAEQLKRRRDAKK